jgi:hypothetical protein
MSMKTTSHSVFSPRVAALPGVAIQGMHVRLPGESAAGGRRVIERALALAAARLPPGLAGDFGRLSLRVRPRNMTERGLADAIADALIETLTHHGEARHA